MFNLESALKYQLFSFIETLKQSYAEVCTNHRKAGPAVENYRLLNALEALARKNKSAELNRAEVRDCLAIIRRFMLQDFEALTPRSALGRCAYGSADCERGNILKLHNLKPKSNYIERETSFEA